MKIKQSFQKNGFIYKLDVQGKRAVMYSQWNDNEIVGYEIHRLRIRIGEYLEGSVTSNRLPRDEDFGKWAWSFKTKIRAISMFHLIEIFGASAKQSRQNIILEDNVKRVN
jgi:hypothetical protein